LQNLSTHRRRYMYLWFIHRLCLRQYATALQGIFWPGTAYHLVTLHQTRYFVLVNADRTRPQFDIGEIPALH
jgi:hypothetical protein